jgi:type II secretory pathway predicted ATPase ExeA
MTLWEMKLGKEARFEDFLRKWGLVRDPFTFDLPTPEAFVPPQPRELRMLKQLLMEGKVGVLTGSLGMGKTTVCEFLTAALREESLLSQDPETQVIPILIHGAAYKSAEEFLRAIIHGLGLDANKDPAGLFEFLRRWSVEHREKLAIMVDDVPESRADFLEIGEFFRVLADLPSISLLLNGEENQMKRFLKKVPALKDRVQLWVTLRPFPFQAIQDMLRYRLKYASFPSPPGIQLPAEGLIMPDGYVEIYDASNGRPRVALKIAAKALRIAADANTQIDFRVVRKAYRRPFWRGLFRFW